MVELGLVHNAQMANLYFLFSLGQFWIQFVLYQMLTLQLFL